VEDSGGTKAGIFCAYSIHRSCEKIKDLPTRRGPIGGRYGKGVRDGNRKDFALKVSSGGEGKKRTDLLSLDQYQATGLGTKKRVRGTPPWFRTLRANESLVGEESGERRI